QRRASTRPCQTIELLQQETLVHRIPLATTTVANIDATCLRYQDITSLYLRISSDKSKHCVRVAHMIFASGKLVRDCGSSFEASTFVANDKRNQQCTCKPTLVDA